MAICDDEKVETDYLTNLAYTWAATSDFDIYVTTFDSAESFLFAYEDMPRLDILLLDIQMGGMDGMSLARHLRINNDHLHIIFITGYQDFMAEGYDVAALHYLMKPVDQQRLFSVLDKAQLSKPKPELLVQTTGTTIKVAHKDIIYIEAFAHYVQITTTTGILQTRANISDITQALGESFARCHRSYIVGLRHVRHITKTDIVLDSGVTIPLSRRLHKDVSQVFVKFHKGV